MTDTKLSMSLGFWDFFPLGEHMGLDHPLGAGVAEHSWDNGWNVPETNLLPQKIEQNFQIHMYVKHEMA